jgi:hypothetical protein
VGFNVEMFEALQALANGFFQIDALVKGAATRATPSADVAPAAPLRESDVPALLEPFLPDQAPALPYSKDPPCQVLERRGFALPSRTDAHFPARSPPFLGLRPS